MTIKSRILEYLKYAESPVAAHETQFFGTNGASLYQRFYELQKAGTIIGRTRKDKTYHEYYLVSRRTEFEVQPIFIGNQSVMFKEV